jgi:DNA-binding NarL/FixJ family response regulator
VLAADGRSNREIAQELFVTVATVETHLRRAYRKLGVEGPQRAAGGARLVRVPARVDVAHTA